MGPTLQLVDGFLPVWSTGGICTGRQVCPYQPCDKRRLPQVELKKGLDLRKAAVGRRITSLSSEPPRDVYAVPISQDVIQLKGAGQFAESTNEPGNAALVVTVLRFASVSAKNENDLIS